MKLNSNNVKKLLLLALLTTLFTACSARLTGSVYYDSNNNGIRDEDEIGAGYVKLIIMKDDEVLAEGYTYPDGTFAKRIKDKGIYCVRVDQASLDEISADIGVKASIVKAVAMSDTDKENILDADTKASATDDDDDTDSDTDDDDKDDDRCVDADLDGSCDKQKCPDEDKDGECDNIEETQERKYESGKWTDKGYCKTVKRYKGAIP